MNRKKQIGTDLIRLSAILEQDGTSSQWAKRLARLGAKSNTMEEYSLRSQVKSMFGGMGSLNDLYLKSSQNQAEFYRMKSQLYDLVSRELGDYGIFFERESVCSADDVNAPNRYEVMASNLNLSTILGETYLRGYLPCIHKTVTKWRASVNNTLKAFIVHGCDANILTIELISDEELPHGATIYFSRT